MTDKPMTVGDVIKEDKTPIGIAVDLLFKKRDNLLDDYQGEIIAMSQSYSVDKYNYYCSNLDRIHKEIKFVTRILSLSRDGTRFSLGDLPSYSEEAASG